MIVEFVILYLQFYFSNVNGVSIREITLNSRSPSEEQWKVLDGYAWDNSPANVKKAL